jgi:hypothetical protein
MSMPTRPSSRFLATYVAALLLLSSGCSLLSDDDPADPAPSSSNETPGVQLTDAPPDTLTSLTSTLQRRADAVRSGDEEAFLAGLTKRDEVLREQQSTYFENLQQLPIGTFAYSIDPQNIVRQGEDYSVVVELALQLDGFDEAPVVSRDRYLFTPGEKPGRFRLASVSDPAWEVENKVLLQPWDEDKIVVVRGTNVLGIFDEGSVRAAKPLVRSVERGIADVAGVVPSAWSQTVVVYALSNTAFLATLPGLPSDDPSALDGVAFPVFASVDGGALVATRFVLHPRMLDERGRARDRLVRHELTHVAIGEDDDHAPVWLSEGLAEYVSVQPLPPEKRTISEVAIEAARAGVTNMPTDDSFNEGGTPPRTSANYGIAWFACEYLAASYGEVTLWQLLAAMNEPDADPDQVLTAQLGLNLRTLARKAGKLILETYEPEPDPTELPTGDPTDLPTDGTTGVPTETPDVEPTATPTP